MIAIFFVGLLIAISLFLWVLGSTNSALMMLVAALLLGVVAIVVSSGKGGDATE